MAESSIEFKLVLFMIRHLYCIALEGRPLTESLQALLFDTAQDMMDEGLTAKTIKTKVAEGEITTDNEQVSIGGWSGTSFEANLDTNDQGTFKVLYMVRPTRKVRGRNIRWQEI